MPSKSSGRSGSTLYKEGLELYERLVATLPEVERKGATMPYTSVGGNMFSLFTKQGTLALRLPADERSAFLEQYQTRLTEQYGAVMREYVDVPSALLSNTRTLKRYFAMSYEYAKSLKPKPTTRSSTAKKRR
jgi:TfoX/Sxy family transcriptional regulator of competence genes